VKGTVFCFFRETPERVNLLNGQGDAAQGSYLFAGADRYAAHGWKADFNLNHLPHPKVRAAGNILSRLFFKAGGYGGDFATVLTNLRRANRADVVFSTVDTVGIPLAFFRRLGLLRRPLVYMSIGLCERLDGMRDAYLKRRQVKSLQQCALVAGYGWEEVRRLQLLLGPGCPTRFMPFGVDVESWQPRGATKTVDVLSLGADIQRDFSALKAFAARNPARRVKIITTDDHRKQSGQMPPNVEFAGLVPLSLVAQEMAAARVIALPVRENTYSGATTTLLQAMSMELPAVVSSVGAVREGYGLKNDRNCCLVAPGDAEAMAAALEKLLNNPEQAAALGKAARAHVKADLNWANYVNRLIELLDFAAGGS